MTGETAGVNRPLRIAYLSGPAEAVRFLREMRDGTSDYFGTNYMKLFLRLAEDIGAEVQVVTWHDGEAYDTRIGRFRFINRPMRAAAGLRYQLFMLFWHLPVLARFLAFRPDVVVVTGNQDFWWTLAPLRLTGARLVASYHNMLWVRFSRRKAQSRLYAWLNARLVLRAMPAVITASSAIREQVERLVGTGPGAPYILEQLPSYRREQFDAIPPPRPTPGTPFETIFLGRVEANKGVFDVLEVAERLERERPGEFRFHVCGDGTQLPELRARIEAAGLGGTVLCHGYCRPEQVQAVMGRSHASIVPTRSECEAGFEMTCAEAVLSGRPLVSTAVCPALHYLGPAAMEVAPDDVDGYVQAIRSLKDDPALFRRLQAACGGLKDQFFDERNGWSFAMREALALAVPGRSVREGEA